MYPGNSITDLSPNAPGARSALCGSQKESPSASSRYSMRSTCARRYSSRQQPFSCVERRAAAGALQLLLEADGRVAVVLEPEDHAVRMHLRPRGHVR